MSDPFAKYTAIVSETEPMKFTGRVERVQGLLIESLGPQAVLGELCTLTIPRTGRTIAAEVVGLKGKTIQLMPFDEIDGLEVGCEVRALGETLRVPVGPHLLGRVLDGRGKALDGAGDPATGLWYPALHNPPDALNRAPIRKKITTGVRALDGLVPLGQGQRLGIFAGSGVGKSTLLGMIARNTNADVNVVALIGERSREVREFIDNDLGPEGLARSVLVVATSNTPPLTRIRAAYVATAIAEYFRDQGKNVMLLFDSVTRFANAQREIGLAVGEPPATRGYTPSVFSLLPKLLERCGTSDKGTITGLYTVLVDGDDLEEPISDAVRGILDGHLILSRKLAEQHHFPAVDVLKSVSRLANKVSSPPHLEAIGRLRRQIALFADSEDLINAGAYVKGSNPELDVAIARMPEIRQYLRQGIEEKSSEADTLKRTFALAGLNQPVETS